LTQGEKNGKDNERTDRVEHFVGRAAMSGSFMAAQGQTAAAQGSNTKAHSAIRPKPDSTVGKRYHDQPVCSASGVQSGYLAVGETANLECLQYFN